LRGFAPRALQETAPHQAQGRRGPQEEVRLLARELLYFLYELVDIPRAQKLRGSVHLLRGGLRELSDRPFLLLSELSSALPQRLGCAAQ
jgi:hypothetical protein